MTLSVAEPTDLVIERAEANQVHGMPPTGVRDACGDRFYVAPAFGLLWAVGMHWAAPADILRGARRYMPSGVDTIPGCYVAVGGRFEMTPAKTVPDPAALLTAALATSTDPLTVSGRCVRPEDPALILTDANGTDRYAASVRYLQLLAGRSRDPLTRGVPAIQRGYVDVTGAPGLAPLVLRRRRTSSGDPCDRLLGLLMPVRLSERG